MRFCIIWQLLLIFSLCTSCEAQREKIEVIEVNHYGQFFDFERKGIFSIGNTTRIAFSGDERLYITANIALTTKDVLDGKGKKIDEIVTRQDTTYDVHAFRIGATHGLSYSLAHFKEDKGTPFNVDTLLKGIDLDEKNLLVQSMELGAPEKIVKKKHRVLEKFSVIKKDDSYPDSVYRYFDRDLKYIKFSLSDKLDKESNSKLVKTLFIYNPTHIHNGKEDYKIPRRVLETSITRIRYPHIEILKEIFQKFRED